METAPWLRWLLVYFVCTLSVSVQPASGRSPALFWWLRFTPNYLTQMVKHWRWRVGTSESQGWWKNSFTLDLVTLAVFDLCVAFQVSYSCGIIAPFSSKKSQTPAYRFRTKTSENGAKEFIILPKIIRFNFQVIVSRLKNPRRVCVCVCMCAHLLSRLSALTTWADVW